MKSTLFVFFALIVFIVGGFLGWCMHPEPMWDISEDKRSCLIYWDDGGISYKPRIRSLGTLKPGESKTIKITPPDNKTAALPVDVRQEWKRLPLPHVDNFQIRVYVDAAGEHWPCPDSLWSYYEYSRLCALGVDSQLAMKRSEPFMTPWPPKIKP